MSISTTSISADRAARIGMICAVGAAFAFSLNDMLIKFLSTGYPLHQIVLTRSIIGLALVVAFVIPFEGGVQALKTRRPFVHLLRGLFVVLANTFFFLALAAMPLADATAIFFVSPLMITGLSVLLLGETVGLRRWAAVAIGLLGVFIIARPTSESFQPASILVILSALFYALLHILTRRIGATEKASTMAVYIQITFVIVSSIVGLTVGDGRFAVEDDPSLRFLLAPWIWPPLEDFAIMAALGAFSAMGGYLISQAYRSSEAGLIAPFEYVALVMSVFWGFMVFSETPDSATWTGIGLIIASGVYIALREAKIGRRSSVRQTSGRR